MNRLKPLGGAALKAVLDSHERYLKDVHSGKQAILPRRNLNGADFRGRDLTVAHLEESTMIGADFTGAKLGATRIMRADLREAKGLTEKMIRSSSCEGVILPEPLHKMHGKLAAPRPPYKRPRRRVSKVAEPE